MKIDLNGNTKAVFSLHSLCGACTFIGGLDLRFCNESVCRRARRRGATG